MTYLKIIMKLFCMICSFNRCSSEVAASLTTNYKRNKKESYSPKMSVRMTAINKYERSVSGL